MLSRRLEDLTKKVEEKKASSKDEKGSEQLLKRVSGLESEVAEKRRDVEAFRDSDPEALKRMGAFFLVDAERMMKSNAHISLSETNLCIFAYVQPFNPAVTASNIGYESAVRWTDNVWCLEVRIKSTDMCLLCDAVTEFSGSDPPCRRYRLLHATD